MYRTILFDLDGTLVDSGAGITNSVAYALQKYGIQIPERSELYKFIGPPLQYSFETFCGFSKEEANKAVAYYREYYSVKGIFENILYDGMADLLQSLYHAGKKLLLATSKPEQFAIRILDYFDISQYFDSIVGSCMNGTRCNKDEVIAAALEIVADSQMAFQQSDVVMVGDRSYDILGAKKNQIDSIGVLYGYGTREELEEAGASYIAEKVSDIGLFTN